MSGHSFKRAVVHNQPMGLIEVNFLWAQPVSLALLALQRWLFINGVTLVQEGVMRRTYSTHAKLLGGNGGGPETKVRFYCQNPGAVINHVIGSGEKLHF